MAAEYGESSESALRKELQCSVCLDLFQDPVILSCGHNFCQSCILHVWDSGRAWSGTAGGNRRSSDSGGNRREAAAGGEGATGRAGAYSCPECRQTFSTKSFTKNFLVANLVEKLQKKPPAPSPPSNGVVKWCEKHQKPLTMYCRTDQEVLCAVCRSSRAHRNCDVLLAHEVVEEFPAQMRQRLDWFLQERELFVSVKKTEDETIVWVKRRKEELRVKISSEFAKLIEFLIEEQDILLTRLEEEQEAILGDVESNQVDLGSTIAELEQSIADIQSKLNHSVPLEEMLDSISRPAPELDKPMVTRVAPCWDMFTGPLQFIAWKRMLDVINPAPENLYFDPTTAHPNLTFYSNYTAVESCTSRSPVSDNPERFNRFQAVLATTHFPSGRHYWEVDVGHSLGWYLGVTCLHSSRKGYVKLSPQNHYWSISRQLDYCINEDLREPLDLECELTKVGIYLDFEAGQVSFYDACCMTHLYTFKAVFPEPIVPFLSPSKETDGVLQLCHF
ncbi:zinc-binding protein A33 isoform X2 [Callorhinchus milii]|uniref:E3 ubiquitin-protein ligase TRIM41 n=1 Tax=Callorhinchus milii TaxID=7868 RepID=V9KST5_CALMI|nr:zinc-binding protein A33 isoform X2 [Callorhinchus milii]|eukprot:gi/632991632/ref/XP_007884716.1/ PREDICTED: zinc-binding protein A33-like [Callorhinchus milii]